MKTLLILRHAKSNWADPGMTDHNRPLNSRGKHDAPRIGQLLREQGLVPDLILSSTAKRARSTAKRVVEGGELTCEPQLLDELYLAPAATYVALLRRQAAEHGRILVIGHNPGLEELVLLLTGTCVALPTAALVQVGFEIDTWFELPDHGVGKLVASWEPRELA
ncbi:MAG TPA: histidine phosphatase family protein [Pirellulaceae bacterium]|nr:histidine phosphatase family protein [Pirellulaceae bacterium]